MAFIQKKCAETLATGWISFFVSKNCAKRHNKLLLHEIQKWALNRILQTVEIWVANQSQADSSPLQSWNFLTPAKEFHKFSPISFLFDWLLYLAFFIHRPLMWFWPLSPRHSHSWRGAKGLSPWPWWHYSINEYYVVTLFLDTWTKAVLWIQSCIIHLQNNYRFLVNATTLVFCFLASLPLTYIFFLQTFSLLQIAQCCLMDCTCTAAMSRPLLTHKAVLFCKDMNGWSYSLQIWNLASW